MAENMEVTMRVVADIPPVERRSRYTILFERIAKLYPPGTAVEVGTFASRSGARMTRDRILSGDVAVPYGPDAWEIEARSKLGEGSTLYARFLGEPDG